MAVCFDRVSGNTRILFPLSEVGRTVVEQEQSEKRYNLPENTHALVQSKEKSERHTGNTENSSGLASTGPKVIKMIRKTRLQAEPN